MKFIATNSDKISSIEVKTGQLIFSRDDRVIYLDTDVRTSFQQIITVAKEETLAKLPSPVEGFYFAEDTTTLWRYKNTVWTQLTSQPEENIVFLDRENFPAIGKENVLYVDKTKIYQWDTDTQEYCEMGGSALLWEAIA